MPVKVERWECVVCHNTFKGWNLAQTCERGHRPPRVKALGRDISIQMQGRGFILCGPDSAKGNLGVTVNLILGDLEIAGLIQFVEENKTQGYLCSDCGQPLNPLGRCETWECGNNPPEKKTCQLTKEVQSENLSKQNSP